MAIRNEGKAKSVTESKLERTAHLAYLGAIVVLGAAVAGLSLYRVASG